MKLTEVKMIDVGKARKIADSATKVIISGIDKIVGTKNPADEYQYYTLIKSLIEKRFEQIIRKRFERGYKTVREKR
tara:strand:+ start:869 stop:1096 length:228 start_codon:yes stop_codon:yes gene_type:complete